MTTDRSVASPRAARPRGRRLKTWTAFGELGRRPSEYEILTHGLNHTTGQPPLELGPDVHGNRWLCEHRDSTRLRVGDWNAFRDPDAVTYGSYVAMQDDQETYVEGLLEQFDRDGHDTGLTSEALDYIAVTVTPGRYLAHGQQMLSAYVQQLAPSSYVAIAATFQTADQLRRVQLAAYRTAQLQREFPGRAFGTGERATWETDPEWQPVREAVEHALVEFDWDRAVVATQLVVKPVADLLFLQQLGCELTAAGSALDGHGLHRPQPGWAEPPGRDGPAARPPPVRDHQDGQADPGDDGTAGAGRPARAPPAGPVRHPGDARRHPAPLLHVRAGRAAGGQPGDADQEQARRDSQPVAVRRPQGGRTPDRRRPLRQGPCPVPAGTARGLPSSASPPTPPAR